MAKHGDNLIRYVLSRTCPNIAGKTVSEEEPLRIVWFILQLNSIGHDWVYDGVLDVNGNPIMPGDDMIDVALDDRSFGLIRTPRLDSQGKPVLDSRDGLQKEDVLINSLECKKCMKRFTRLQDWFNHSAERYEDETKYSCEHCYCYFADPLILSEHMRTNHWIAQR